MKDQTTAVQNEIKTLQSSETLIDKQMTDALKQTQTTVPDQIHKVESETQIMRAQKKAINGEIQTVKDQINEINIQDVQLTGQGTAKITTQVNPSSKAAIDEKDIVQYAQICEKIRTRLGETFKLIPPQHLPERSPDLLEKALPTTAKKSATPFTPLPISPSPAQNPASASGGFNFSAISNKSGGGGGFGGGLFQFDQITKNLSTAVQQAAQNVSVRIH